MTFKNVLILWLFAIFAVANAAAQKLYKLSGTVQSEKKEPLVGATVRIGHGTKGAVTGQDGTFSLSIEEGQHLVVISCVGYKANETSLKVNKDMTVNFTLAEDVVTMNNVVVTGESKISKVRSSVYSANAVDIASHLSSILSVENEVKKGMGIRIRHNGGLGSDMNLTLNGMGGDAVRYYIDGVPMSTKGEGLSLENIPVNIVDRVEIYKGVVPAYLGGDALGGAINIITKEKKKNFYDLSYQIGSFHTHVVNFNAQIVEPKTGLTFKPTIGYNYSKNDYKMKNVRVLDAKTNQFEYGDFRRFHDGYHSLYSQLEMGFTNKSWADYLYLTGSYNDLGKDVQTGATQDVVYGAVRRKTRSWNVGLRYRQKDLLLEGLTMTLDANHTGQTSTTIDTAMVIYYWNGTYRPNNSGSAEISSYPVTRKYHRPNSSVRVNFDYQVSEQSALNLNYQLTATSDRMTQETIDDTRGTGGATDKLTRHFLNLSYDLGLFDNRWHTTFFVKEFANAVCIEKKEVGNGSNWNSGYDEDNSHTTKWFTSYGVGTRYKFLDALSAKVSYEYSVRLPGATELLGDGDNINANYALEPEKSNNYNLNLYGNVKFGNQFTWFYEGGIFYRNVHDFIMAVQDRESYTFKNVSRVGIKGAELETGINYADQFMLKGNLSYEKAVDMMQTKLSDGKPNAAYKQQVPNRPTLYSNINASYTLWNLFGGDNKLMFEYDYEYTKWFYLTWATYGHKDSKSIIPTQNCHNFSATFSWQENRYSISVECDNLFDNILFDNYKLQRPGRSFNCKFRIFFS